MSSNTPVAAMIPGCRSDNFLKRTAPTPSIERDVDIEKALRVDDAVVQDIPRSTEPVLIGNRLPMVQTHQNLSPDRFDNDFLSTLRTAAGMTSRVPDSEAFRTINSSLT